MNTLRLQYWIVTPLIALLAACSGGTGGTGATSTTAVSYGVMLKGSTIVNGVRYDDSTATIRIDDNPKTAADLRDGMVVKVSGTVNGDGINGTANEIEAEIEVRGAVTNVFPGESPQRLVVLGQDIIVDDLTIYSHVSGVGFGAITVGMLVEVHGLRDTGNRIRATRIETNPSQMGDNTVDEIRGIVSGGTGTNPATFNLGSQAVNATGALIVPSGANYQNGSMVEVHCSARPCANGGVFQASRVEVESAEDTAFQPGDGVRFEVEGLIAGFTAHPGTFTVAGTPVVTTASTVFVGGIATDLANDIKIEAEGSWNGSMLAATKIEFKRSVIRLQGIVTTSGGSTFTLDIAGNVVTIETDSLTSGSVPVVGPNCVQVRGQRKAVAGAVVTAGEINNSCSNSDRPVMQAPVEAESPETTITLIGFVLNVSNPTDTPQYVDINDQPINRTQFFTAVSPASLGPPAVAGTLVKVIFNDGANTVRQVEIED